MMESINFTIV